MVKNMIKKIDRQSLSEKIYIELKKAIVEMVFKPGERISDMELAQNFGVSRTPVREAIKRLEDDGLIESIPGSMTRVTHISSEEAKNAFTVVAVLHALAARLAVPVLTGDDIRNMETSNLRLKQALDVKDAGTAIQSDAAFHQVILDRADNPEILNVLKRLTPKIDRLERVRFLLKGNESVSQHALIIQACADNDIDQAASLVEKNWLTLSEWSDR